MSSFSSNDKTPAHKAPSSGMKVKDHGKDPKQENPGAIAKDSLAAESIRSESGTFAGGRNPGISDVTGASSTFAAEGGKEITGPGGKKTDPEERGHAPVYQTKRQTRSQTHAQQHSTGGEDDSARGSAHTGGSQQKGTEKTMSHHGGDAPANTATTGGKSAYAEREITGKIGESAEDVDWKNISKDVTTVDIGSEDDPARKVETEFSQRSARAPGADTAKGSDFQNPYGALEGREEEA